MSTVTELFAQIKKLNLAEKRALNSLLVTDIKHALRHAQVMQAIQFSRGDVVKFDGKTRGPIFIEITGASRDFTKLKGRQLNRGWKTAAGTPWTVSANLCSKATREEALAA